jgi:hypothetical protein
MLLMRRALLVGMVMFMVMGMIIVVVMSGSHWHSGPACCCQRLSLADSVCPQALRRWARGLPGVEINPSLYW